MPLIALIANALSNAIVPNLKTFIVRSLVVMKVSL